MSLRAQDRKLVIASASMIADIAANIIREKHDIEMIVPIGGDPHLHEPTPRDARLVAAADLILVNGLTFEGWINELIQNSGTEAVTVTVTENIPVLTSQTYRNSSDPHAWMDASNGIIYAENIRNAISQLDPENESIYSKNLEQYTEQLSKLDENIARQIKSIPGEKRVLITSHDAFQYYGKRYNIQLEAIMGISTEADAQTSDIMRVNKVIREKKIPAVFIESTINPKLMEQLAADNRVVIGGKLYADSLGDQDSPASTYIDMLRHNTSTIVKALTSDSTQLIENQSRPNYVFLILLGVILVAGLFMAIFYFNR